MSSTAANLIAQARRTYQVTLQVRLSDKDKVTCSVQYFGRRRGGTGPPKNAKATNIKYQKYENSSNIFMIDLASGHGASNGTTCFFALLGRAREGVLMIEGEGDFVSEEDMMRAIEVGHEAVVTLCVGEPSVFFSF